MNITEKKKSHDFNIYYLNFSKVYEIAMMINNVILTKIERDKSYSFEEQYGFTSSVSAKGTKQFLDGIKASISAETKETATSSSKVVESLDVKTTKSILLRRVIEQCASVNKFDNSVEGDLVKVDHVKLELLDEDSLRQFLILRRDALKGMGDTIKPRLVEAGADLSRVMVIDDTEEALTLSDDRIEKAVRQNHVRLVIIDPVQAFIGADVDMNRANEVRPVFRKLGMIAEKTGCAIVLIGHLNKSSGTQSTYRGLGSIDIMAAVRSLIFIGKVRKDPTTRVLIHEKSSLAPPGETMAFKLGDEEGFRWVGAYEISADELLDGKEGKATETKLERGRKLIRELLADKKEISIRELDEKAKEQGISGRTMRDVRSRMKNELEYKVNEKQENSIRLKE